MQITICQIVGLLRLFALKECEALMGYATRCLKNKCCDCHGYKHNCCVVLLTKCLVCHWQFEWRD